MSAAGEIQAVQRERIRIVADTEEEISRLLAEAYIKISRILMEAPTDYQSWYLPRLKKAIAAAMNEAERRAAVLAGHRMEDAWELGTALVNNPLAANGVVITTLAPIVNAEQLLALKEFTTDKIKDATLKVVNRINSELSLTVIGSQSVSDTVSRIETLVDGGRSRALAITRTEIGRVYSAATQSRLNQAAERVPGLRKMWVGSGKKSARETHAAAHGQHVGVPDEFSVGAVKMRYPRDPRAPVGEVVNCGCTVVPFHPDWR